MTCVLQSRQTTHFYQWLLAAFWFSGLLSGFFFFQKTMPVFFSLMRGSSFSSVSIVGLILSSLLPFLICGFSALYFRPILFFSVCFFKTFFFVFVSSAMILRYCPGSWLIQRFVMFHDILSFPVLYIFCARCLRFRGLPPASECLIYLLLEILILAMTYRIWDPFLLGLEIL